MEVITAQRKPGDFKGKRLTKDDFDTLVDFNAEIRDQDGNFVAAFKKKAISTKSVAKAWTTLRDWHPITKNRATASGVKMVEHKKLDGTIGKRNIVPPGYEVESGVFGFMDRYPAYPYCRPCAWNDDQPENMEAVMPLVYEVQRLHEAMDSEGFKRLREFAEKTLPNWRLPDSVYTTVTVNKNFRTAAHLDAKNLREASAAMAYIREGKLSGGEVVFPEFRIAVRMDTTDLIVFRNMSEWHGNTPIVKLSKDAQRCTLVHYFREGMIYCGTPDQELERAKRRKAGETLLKDNLNPEAEGML